MTKRCSVCGKEKPVEEFWKCISHKDGLHSWCKSCMREARRKAYWADPEKYRKKSREYGQKHPDKRQAKWKRWYEANRKKRLEYVHANRKRHTEYMRTWSGANREKVRTACREYMRRDRDKLGDNYVKLQIKRRLRDSNIEISQDMIELYRKQLSLGRAVKSLQEVLNGSGRVGKG